MQCISKAYLTAFIFSTRLKQIPIAIVNPSGLSFVHQFIGLVVADMLRRGAAA